MTETIARAVGEIRRYYEGMRVPVVPTTRAREDVLQLLEERKALQRAGEALVAAAASYNGDATVRQAIDAFKEVLEGRRS